MLEKMASKMIAIMMRSMSVKKFRPAAELAIHRMKKVISRRREITRADAWEIIYCCIFGTI